ncbi:MAG: hypothetical protein AB9M53_02190 [Leptothrix sp. (in: b-proteobacteria)]
MIAFGFALRLFVAIWNSFFGPSPGAELDAASFHEAAVAIAIDPSETGLSTGWIYADLLGLIYRYSISHLFIGSMLSCLAWVLSAYILKQALRISSADPRTRSTLLGIYAILPSSVFLTSITLREVYQLLFVNILALSLLNIFILKKKGFWLIAVVAAICMSTLHGGLAIFATIAILFAALKTNLRHSDKPASSKRTGSRNRFAIFSIGIIVASIILVPYLIGSDLLSLLDTTVAYQNNVLGADGRTNYKEATESVSPSQFLFSLPVTLIQYLIEPMPWRNLAVADIPVMAENALRVAAICTILKSLKYLDGRPRLIVISSFSLFLLLEFIWAMGTVNWGTAVRHHIPSLGLLAIAGSTRPLYSRSSKLHQSQVNSSGVHQ